MPQYLKARQKATWTFLPRASVVENIKLLLTKMAIFRQAKIDKVTLELYAEALAQFTDLRAFQVAMATLAESPRQEGETALPSLGDIIEAMKDAREEWPDFKAGRTKLLIEPDYAEPEPKRLKA
jgi:hypothetical protein